MTPRYEIRIRGRVSDSLLASFAGLDAEFEPAETVLHGLHMDQAALHGILIKVRDLGLPLLAVTTFELGFAQDEPS